MKIRKFVDHVTAHVRAGKGGNGIATFRREAYVPKGGPDGGNGGRGGSVILQGNHHTDSLSAIYLKPRLFAENGMPGQKSQMTGRNGRNLVVPVPCGTKVIDPITEREIADITEHGQEVIIARGGEGGLGNINFKSSTNQAPTECTKGAEGEEFRLRLELKIIADAGLLGFPNAGKSSLLRCVSSAKPKIGNYPFTTLNPIIGCMQYPDFSQLRIADVPGIIDGAADGIGLGTRFLQHISRSHLLVYIIDMAGSDNRHPWEDYKILLKEVEQYDRTLLERPSLVVANKMDQPDAAENLKRFVKECGITPIEMSALSEDDPGVVLFKARLYEILQPQPPTTWE